MTTIDWIIDITLIVIVLRQVRDTRVDRSFVLIPLAIVAVTAAKYLHAIPTGGNDLILIAACVGLGALLGMAGGLTTHVRAAEGRAFARAGWVAASLWVLSMAARLAFIVWITSSAGGASLARFSIDHDITGGDAWQDALVLLALAEVVVRLAVILARSERVKRNATPVGPARQLVTA